jgi:HEAT repeat protein/beta-lactamase regulating signal transducer with metallopeptidase domain
MTPDIARSALGWALTYLLHSTLLLGLAWLLTRRRLQSHAAREIVWKAALVGGLATASFQNLAALEPLGGDWGIEWSRPEAARPQVVPAGDGHEVGHRVTALSADAGKTPVRPGVAETSPGSNTVAPGVAATATGETRLSSWVGLLLWTWLAAASVLVGGFLMLRRQAIRRIGPRRAVKETALLGLLDTLCRAAGIRRVIRLTAAPALPSPVALGDREICIPEAVLTELDPDQQRTMLAHELAHLARRDPQWLTAACVLERLFFFQPLNRLARRQIQEAAEFLCDDWAVRQTGAGFSLARCLVKVAEWVDHGAHPVPLSAMAERRSQLVTRIHRLIENRAMTPQPSTRLLMLGTLGLLTVTAVVAPSVTGHRPTGTAGSRQGAVQDSLASSIPADTDTVHVSGLEELQSRVNTLSKVNTTRAMHEAERQLEKLSRKTSAWAVAPRVAVGPLMSATPRAYSTEQRSRDSTNSVAVPALIAALRDTDAAVRRAAAQSLGQLGDSRAVSPLVDALKDGDTEVRCNALQALASLNAHVPTAALQLAFKDRDAAIRKNAVQLATSGDEDTRDQQLVGPITELLKDPDADVRQAAAEALGQFGLTQAPAGLLDATRDKSADVRQASVESLGEIHDPHAVPALKSLLSDPSSDVREAAVEALSEIRDRAALDALIQALKASDPVVRRHAAEALGQRGD